MAKVLVANKTDLDNRIITREQGQALAEQHGLSYFETSAKTGTNINELFYFVARQIVKDRPAPSKSTQASTGYGSYVSQ